MIEKKGLNVDLHLKELSLFSGAGGGLLGTTHLLGWETVCYVEWDDYAAKVLQARIADGFLHDAPIWSNVRTFDAHAWRGCVDVISAGFPCQPFSGAGKMGAGLDERNGWPDTARIIRDIRPQYVYLENVAGLLAKSHGYFGTVLSELAALGYDVKWEVLSAADCGAPHRRDRLWIHGHANGNG
jgi:DNA (cytosine-5)-methyltransferase 1